MNIVKVIGVACLIVMGVAVASAQQQAPQQQAPVPNAAAQQQAPPAQEPAPSVARGELVKVDAEAKTIAIKNDQGAEMKFSYTTATKVVGADGTVAGLGKTSGTKVVVKYRAQGQMLVASEIEVQKEAA